MSYTDRKLRSPKKRLQKSPPIRKKIEIFPHIITGYDADIEGMPEGIQIIGYMSEMDMLRNRTGRWKTRVTSVKRGYYGDEDYELEMLPVFTPSIKKHNYQFLSDDRVLYYDSSIVKMEPPMEGHYTPEAVSIDPRYTISGWRDPPKGFLWRGLSFEEMEFIRGHGHIRSEGEYNIGDEQAGLTYFSWKFDQANSYASGFAPPAYQASFGYPSYIIGVLPPKKESHAKGDLVSYPEQGIKGKTDISRILEICEVRAVVAEPKKIEIRHTNSFSPIYEIGSTYGHSPTFAYRFLTPKEVNEFVTERKLPST